VVRCAWRRLRRQGRAHTNRPSSAFGLDLEAITPKAPASALSHPAGQPSCRDTLLNQAIESRPSLSDKRSVVKLVQKVENGVSRYLPTITVINIGMGAVTACAMWLIGIPNAVLWGVMAATLNYVPHLGAMVCMVVLFLVGAVAQESLWFGAGAALVFLVITATESYFVTPLVLSRSLQLSPLAVIVALLLLGWLWGIAGGLMAAPSLAVVKITCD